MELDMVIVAENSNGIVAVPADDPTLRPQLAYAERMHAEAVHLRELADLYDALAANATRRLVAIVPDRGLHPALKQVGNRIVAADSTEPVPCTGRCIVGDCDCPLQEVVDD